MAELIAEKYEILEEIGRGGMGTVYKAYQRSLDRVVAIKVLYENLADDPEFRARFQNEATIVAHLTHPNIVAVFDIERHGKTFAIIMEYVEGQSLQKLVEAGTLDERTTLLIGAQIARALHHAHQQGVIHRDVKPDNILVKSSGVAKITDFGIARFRGGKFRTQTGVSMGTPRFMSPEQVTGHDVDGRSDLYSLGVCLYYCLTGKVPFDGDNAFAVATRHIYEKPLPPSEINPAVSPAAEMVVMRALQKRKEDRFATGEEMAEALEEAAHAKSPIIVSPSAEATEVPQGATRRLDFTVTSEPSVLSSGSAPRIADSPPAPASTPQFLDELVDESIRQHTPPPARPARNVLLSWILANWGIVAAFTLVVGALALLLTVKNEELNQGRERPVQGDPKFASQASRDYDQLLNAVERAVREGRRVEAVQRVEAFRDKYPSFQSAEIDAMLDRLTAALPLNEAERLAKRREEKGRRFLNDSRRLPLARAYLKAARELYSGVGKNANFILGESVLKLLDQGTTASRLAQENPAAAAAAISLARKRLESSKAEERLAAEKDFIEAVCLAPDEYEYWLELANFYRSEGMLDDARVLLRYVEENAPKTSTTYQQAARDLRSLEE
ncbi:MAG: serine/threonine protein kinase [Candidatus Sumerlaeaceae bacterium]|nr:serine/threonine protein kinase [Candidatus Sumerlaeaceae bacterium]